MANSTIAGREVARFLLGLGHRAVGFVSLERSQPWARNRFEGMSEIFASAGFPGAVRMVSLGRDGTGAPAAPAARTVLENRDMTALVAETDRIAIECLDCLAALGARPGRDLSVAGFDDTPDAFMHNLTSYNFNCDAVVYAMLAHVSGRRMPRRGGAAQALELEGFVTPRSSTARAPSVK